jgi:hypothetical protein
MAERRNGRTDTELAKAGVKECPICDSCWSLSGFTRHYNSCKAKETLRQKALASIPAQLDQGGSCAQRDLYKDHSHHVYSGNVPVVLPTLDDSVQGLQGGEQPPNQSGKSMPVEQGKFEYLGISCLSMHSDTLSMPAIASPDNCTDELVPDSPENAQPQDREFSTCEHLNLANSF